MKVTFLGTNGWYDTQTGNTPSVMIDAKEAYIVMDAGFGFYKVKELVNTGKPVILCISHLHLDHLIGLHTLPLFKLDQGIDVYLPDRWEKLLKGFLKRPFTTPPLMLSTKLRFHEAGRKKPRLPVKFECMRLRHSVPCYGYRLGLSEGVAAYCTDTGKCGAIKRLAKDADLLITECAMRPCDRSPNLFHLTPEAAATMALEANAKRLALFHFDPGKYPALKDREEAEAAARNIFANTIAANDGTVIEI